MNQVREGIFRMFLKNRFIGGVCALLSIAALGLRFKYYWGREFWTDELNQLIHTKGPLIPFWRWQSFGDVTTFPGDYLLTYPFICFFSEVRWVLRVPHAIFTVLFFYVFYRLCRRYLNTWMGFFIAFLLVALNATLIHHSFEFRPYPVLPALAVIMLYCWERILIDQHIYEIYQKILIAIFCAFVSSFHAYGFYIISISFMYCFFVALQKYGFNKIKEKGYCGMMLVLGFGIWVWYVLGTMHITPLGINKFANSDLHTFRFIPNPMADLMQFLKSILGNLTGNRYLYILLLGLFIFYPIKSSEFKQQLRFCFFLVILPIALILVSSLLNGYAFLQRQFIWVMPFWALLLAKQWDIFFTKFKCLKTLA
jgi:hypothetical protein